MTFNEAIQQYEEIVQNPTTRRNQGIIQAVTFDGIGAFTVGVLSSNVPHDQKIAALEREFLRVFKLAARGVDRPMGVNL